MNKLCEICDTRNRLCMCNGRDGDFKYCFRRVGSTNRLEETITPLLHYMNYMKNVVGLNGLFLKHWNWKMNHMVEETIWYYFGDNPKDN